MTDLKTLKDIPWFDDKRGIVNGEQIYATCIDREELRAEVIKWCKSLDGEGCLIHRGAYPDCPNDGKHYKNDISYWMFTDENEGAKKFLKFFFSISEEELR